MIGLLELYPKVRELLRVDGHAVKEVTVTVSSAEILALFTTPKVLIAAPGAGKVIVLEEVVYTNKFDTGAYAVNAAGVGVQYATSNNAVLVMTQGWGQAVADRTGYAKPTMAGTATTSNASPNEAVELQALVANPTVGAGSWVLKIRYRVVDLPA